MAHINVVVQSINSDDGQLCVDIFERPDKGFGFEEFRRDVEDPSGWFPIGFHSDQTFDTVTEALRAAKKAVVWLSTTKRSDAEPGKRT